jgi:DNA-binding response OmpR family regulator
MEEKPEETITILVIEDNLDMLQLIGRILMEEGYCALLAEDSDFGLALLKETRADLILLDIRMPGKDGYATLKLIRRDYDIPVIMVTANWELESVQKAFSLGADDYLKKPFRPAELIARVKAKLRQSK